MAGSGEKAGWTTIGVRVSPTVRRELRRRATAGHRNLSDEVRMILEAALKEVR